MAKDIDLSSFTANDEDGSGLGWQPIGNESPPFLGTFDGNNHKITGLWINRPSTHYVGLFGYTYGEIKNLGVEIENGKGGVNGNEYTGGLVGLSGLNSSIKNSYATGNVTGTGTYTGGLVGYSYGSITSSYATGNVTGTDVTGGLVGYSSSSIEKCYATGSVTSDSTSGGLVGSSSGSITSSYFDKDATGQTDGVGSGDGSGVAGLNTADMSGTNASANMGFDFDSTWIVRIDTRSTCCEAKYYPELRVFAESSVYGRNVKALSPCHTGDSRPRK